ncbi:T9SS type A sorting domain-containing protein [Gramella sp. KN1008]|uniref:T9SS type A sorting domain-containing protein n=1 Tax=Gramella sp. KN1008 TaxID=2529298 RepID=UPI00103A6B14|nr:T9SS type A sorting domain-containing protein [Gramella sp. KN1008]TBW29223.1 T9SS type A sorting domain-containing protein [Gramella sp. KN1008]
MKKFYTLFFVIICLFNIQRTIGQEECIINVQLAGTEQCPNEVLLDLHIFNTTEYTSVEIHLFEISEQTANLLETRTEPIAPYSNYVIHLGKYPIGPYEAGVHLLDNLGNPVCTGSDYKEYFCTCTDLDNDTICDDVDLCFGDNSTGDADNDGVCASNDNCDLDPNKTEPGICGCGVSDIDSDGDGTADCNDNCDLDPNKTEPGICGCGVSDIDSDGDGIADCNDNCQNLVNPNQEPDGDCDGVPTSEDCNDSDPNITSSNLVDSDGDGTADCNDLCPNDRLKIAPGDCGCGNREIDRDNDGVSDCIDLEVRSTCPNDVDANGVSNDDDQDGVPNCQDICPGFDDNLDFDGDRIPDGCDQEFPYCRGEKIAICHENNGRFTTVCVSPQQLERHRNHPNDNLNGPCETLTASNIIYEEELNMDISLYPNPTTEEFNAELTNVKEQSTVRIYNLLGIPLYETAVGPAEFQTIKINERLAPGTYIIQISSSSENISKKFIIE